MNPLISAVVPTYNRRDSLEITVQSILGQGYDNFELLVVDDGSTDDTLEYLNDLSKTNSKLRVLSRPNDRPKGANACRNIGLEESNGAYVAFLDSDDVWLPNKLEDDWGYLKNREGAVGVYGGILIDDGNEKKRSVTRAVGNNESYVDFIFSEEIVASITTFIVDRTAALEVKFDEYLQRHQDLDFFIRFGQRHGWRYNDKFNTEVSWELGKKRNWDFPSMIQFYEKYKDQISNIDAKSNYLLLSWIKARRTNASYCSYYQGELVAMGNSVGLKYKLFRMAPELLFQLWSLQRKLRSTSE